MVRINKKSEFFRQNLTELMEHRHLSQVELGKRLGISQQVVSAYFSGRAYPSIETLVKLSKIFNLTLYELTNIEALKNIEIKAKEDVDLTPDQQRILDAYIKLDDDDWRKQAIEKILLGEK